MFDPVLKSIADKQEPDLLAFLRNQPGLPPTGKVTVVQPNLPKKTIDADRVYRVSKPGPMLIHTEWESGSNRGRPGRFLVYNTFSTFQNCRERSPKRSEGDAKGVQNARDTLLEVGNKRLGEPTKAKHRVIEQCGSLTRLRRMTIAAVDAPDWATVLATR